MFQIQFVLLISRQGKVRLTKWYSPYTQKERSKVMSIISSLRDCYVVDHQLLDMYFF
jgi:sensor domain CHASE-containing protein